MKIAATAGPSNLLPSSRGRLNKRTQALRPDDAENYERVKSAILYGSNGQMRPPGPLAAPDIVLAAPQCRALWATRPKSLNYAETTEQSNADKSI